MLGVKLVKGVTWSNPVEFEWQIRMNLPGIDDLNTAIQKKTEPCVCFMGYIASLYE